MSYPFSSPGWIGDPTVALAPTATGDKVTTLSNLAGGIVRGIQLSVTTSLTGAPVFGVKIKRNKETGTPTELVGTVTTGAVTAPSRKQYPLVLIAGKNPEFAPGDDVILSIETAASAGVATGVVLADQDPAQP